MKRSKRRTMKRSNRRTMKRSKRRTMKRSKRKMKGGTRVPRIPGPTQQEVRDVEENPQQEDGVKREEGGEEAPQASSYSSEEEEEEEQQSVDLVRSTTPSQVARPNLSPLERLRAAGEDLDLVQVPYNELIKLREIQCKDPKNMKSNDIKKIREVLLIQSENPEIQKIRDVLEMIMCPITP